MLGANDGLLSISGLMIGVAATHTSSSGILASGLAGLVAGALSMGAGEYVSVSSQADIERADLEIERRALEEEYAAERAELGEIYVQRGLDRELAAQVAQQLMAHDALGAHARDEIGITDALTARPLQAAMASSASFALGGIVPLITGMLSSKSLLMPAIAIVSLALLAAIGALAAMVGGASKLRGAARVLIWGTLVMCITGGVGALFGAVA